MSVAQTIAKNSAVLLVAQFLSYLLSFFSVIYIARHLGPSSYGILSFSVAFTGLFVFVADLGLSVVTVRNVAREKFLAPKYFANVGLIKIFLAITAFGLIVIAMNLGQSIMDYPEQTVNVVYLIGLAVVFSGLNHIFYSMFRAFERMEYQSMGQVLHAALMLAGVIAAIRYDFGVVGFASIYLYSSFATMLYSIIIMRWKFSQHGLWSHMKNQIDLSFWKPLLKQALPFAVTLVFISLNYQIDTVLLSAMIAGSDNIVGWYNAAYRLLVMLLSVRLALSQALFPVMSIAHNTSKESLKLICERFFKYSLIMALPIGVGTTILATRFIHIIYGDEFLESAIALRILTWSAVIMYMNFTYSLFQAMNRQVVVMKIVGFGALINVLLDLLLIPFFGLTGAASATVAVSAVSLSIALALFSKTEYTFSISFAMRTAVKVIAATAVMGCFVWYFQSLNLAALVIIAVLIYTAVLFLVRTFDSTDFHIVTGIIRNEPVLTKLDIEKANQIE